MTSNVTPAFRRATPEDAHALATLGATTFTETFGHLYPAEDLQSFLHQNHSVDAWTRALCDPQRGVWLAQLAHDREPVGFILVGPCKLPVENREPNAGEIQQLYVLAKHHNLHIGARLMDCGLDWLAAQGRAPLYIGVWSQNFGAQRFYARYGFAKVGEYGFRVGSTVDDEFILKRQSDGAPS